MMTKTDPSVQTLDALTSFIHAKHRQLMLEANTLNATSIRMYEIIGELRLLGSIEHIVRTGIWSGELGR